jgi:hypothetical protein
MKNIEKGYRGRKVYILCDSQASIKTLNNFQISSKLVWTCDQSQVRLAEHNRFQLISVPGHMGMDGNEVADQLVVQGSLCPFIGPKSALGISAKITREVIRGWTNRKHAEYWQSVRGQRQAKGFLKRPSAKRAGELLSLSRNQLRILIGLLTGHCHLKEHLFNWGLVNSPECDGSKQASEAASRVLCNFEALAALRFRHLGRYFINPGDFKDISISRILHFVQSAGLLNT